MHEILLIIFIIVMVLWLIGGFYDGVQRTPLERGSGLLAWIAVAILGYIVFAGGTGPVH